jgi:predicted RNase H-like nuclease
VTPQVIGVDGTPDGWVAVRLEGREVTGAASYANFAVLLVAEAQARVVAVDMPIGLPTAASWPRAAVQAARDFIGPRRSSVFVVPPLEALEAPDYAEAVRLCHVAGINALSQQAYAMRLKISEVASHGGDRRVFEVHPEVSFAAMNGSPLLHGKRTWNGYHERRALLRAISIEVPEDLGELGRANVDDVLDAVAAAWSGQRIAAGEAERLPPDAAHSQPSIWY